MREIKFRVWDNLKQKMHKLQGMTFDARNSTPAALKLPGLTWRPIEEFELLQWVYLSDMNGVNVYEGDYIKISSTVYNVSWNETIVNFQLEELNGSLSRSIIDVTLGEIIGNIFENSDLYNK
ncbi:MAG TPA: YopX family protein [Clostridium sp.]|uniref:YopX family protein n=1 Tax=Clostridium sp. TaxID=1506 RepID=UPI002F93129A